MTFRNILRREVRGYFGGARVLLTLECGHELVRKSQRRAG